METQNRLWDEIKGYGALVFAILFFSGLFSSAQDWTQIFDFQAIVGAYGPDVSMGGGTGVKEGFLQAVSIAPVMIFSVAFIGCVEYLGGLRAAQKLLTPLLRPLMGVPGVCGLAMILNWQSSDASAAIARQLYEQGRISAWERERLVAYEFITAATIGVFFSNGAILLPYFVCKSGVVLIVIMAMKFLSGNLLRLYQRLFDREGDHMCPAPQGEEAAQAAQAVQSAGPVKKRGLVNVFMDKAAQGFDLWFRKLVPAVLFGYVVVRVLEVTGLMNVIGMLCRPVMELFGLSRFSAYQRLRRMVDKGLLIRVGCRFYLPGSVVPPERQSEVIRDYLRAEGFACRQDLAAALHIGAKQCGLLLRREVESGRLVRIAQRYYLKDS